MGNTKMELFIDKLARKSLSSTNSKGLTIPFVFLISVIVCWGFIFMSYKNDIMGTFLNIVFTLLLLVISIGVGFIIYSVLNLISQYKKTKVIEVKYNFFSKKLFAINLLVFGSGITLRNIVLNNDEIKELIDYLKEVFDDHQVENILFGELKKGSLTFESVVSINMFYGDKFTRLREDSNDDAAKQVAKNIVNS